MTEQQFLRQIKRLLHCKADKKREILRQLESDIASAKEGGKSWEEIRQEWGTPEQFVSEFNEDGRSIQKGKRILIGSVAVICLCGGRCLVCTLARKKQRAAVDKEC